MSYVAGTGLFTNSININIDQIEVNKNDISALNTNLGNFIIDTGNNFQHSSNYVLSTSNILDDKIEDTSNYVLSTSNILDDKIEVLTNVLNGYTDENGYNIGADDQRGCVAERVSDEAIDVVRVTLPARAAMCRLW